VTLTKDADPPLIRVEIHHWATGKVRRADYEVVGGHLKRAG